MAIAWKTETANLQLTALRDEFGAGSVFRVKDSGDVTLAELALDNPAFDAPSGGQMAVAGTPITDSSADATGTAAYFQLVNGDASHELRGSVGTTGSADFVVDGLDVVMGEPVTLESGVLRFPLIT